MMLSNTVFVKTVAYILSTLRDLNGLEKKHYNPLRITQYDSTTPKTTASKMTIKVNHHFSKTLLWVVT